MSFRALAFPVILLAAARAQIPSADVQQKITPIFEQAKAAEREGRQQEALEYYDQVLRLAPGIAEVWANKGLLLHDLNRHPEALRAFLEATRLKPALVTPSLYAGVEYLQLGQPRKALLPLRAALRLDPGNRQARLTLARAHLQLEEYGDAVDQLRESVKREPTAEDSWYQLGAAYLAWSTSTTQVLTGNGSVYGKLLRAEFSAVNGKPEVAQLRYKAAMALLNPRAAAEIPLDPRTLRVPPGPREKQEPESGINRPSGAGLIEDAVVAWREARYGRALRLLRTALKTAPQSSRALYWLALDCRALARESFLRAVESSPNSWQSHLLLADVSAREGDQDVALAEYQKAVTSAPNEPKPRLAQVEHLLSLQRTGEATAKAREAVDLFPRNAELNYRYAQLLLNSDHVNDALPHLQRAIEADPHMAPAHVDLAYAYAELGELQKAIAAMAPVLSQDEDGSLHYKIAAWYRETGQQDLARQALAETARLKAKRVQQEQSIFKDSDASR